MMPSLYWHVRPMGRGTDYSGIVKESIASLWLFPGCGVPNENLGDFLIYIPTFAY